jgi:hypothetical protein
VLERRRVIGTLDKPAAGNGKIVQEQELEMVRQRIAALLRQ